MCIIFVLYQVHPIYPLIIASNRDETLDRPTESMKLRISVSNNDASEKKNKGLDTTEVDNANTDKEINTQHDEEHRQGRRRRSSYLAGKDLVCGGTWFALDVSSMKVDLDDGKNTNYAADCSSKNVDDTKNSESNNSAKQSLLRWIAITNYREEEQHGRPSRGGLLTEYIQATNNNHDCSKVTAQSFVNELQEKGHQYNGFNVLVGDDTGIYYYGNRSVVQDEQNDPEDIAPPPPTATVQPLPPGIYGLSNALLDTPWPKVQRGKELLQQLLHKEQQKHNETQNNPNNHDNSSLKQFHEDLMTILTDKTQPSHDSSLPNTGIGLTSERHLSSIFVPEFTFMGKKYATRSSTSVVVDGKGGLSVLERSWIPEVVDEWFCIERGFDVDDACHVG